MLDTRILLSALWIAAMFTYLLGDVLRIFSGDYKSGEMGGLQMPQWGWMAAAVLMLLPILMLVLTLVLDQPVNRWANIAVAAFLFLFNLVGLPTYPSAYDKFLIAVSLGFNLLTIRYAWIWI